VAALLKDALGVEADLVEGNRREFTVWVGGAKVAGKNWLRVFPSDESVLGKVRTALGLGR